MIEDAYAEVEKKTKKAKGTVSVVRKHVREDCLCTILGCNDDYC